MAKLNPDLIKFIAKEDPEHAVQLERDYKRAMIILARNDPAMFCQYVLRNGKTGGAIYLTPEHVALHKLIQPCSRTAVWTYPEFGKGLDLNTDIPTPSGWVKMSDIQVGSSVFGSDGIEARVIWVSPIQNIRVFDVEFDDGVVIRCDESHLWSAYSCKDRHKNPQPLKLVSTLEMSNSVKHGDRNQWGIPIAPPVQYPSKQLPVHPYLLGAWLGDGDSKGLTLTCHQEDIAIVDRCCQLSGELVKKVPDKRKPHVLRCKIGGSELQKKFRQLGVLGKAGCKFIPAEYLTASEDQRRELLAGLLDTDGTVYTRSNDVSFVEVSFCVERLALDTLELVRSLGFKARLRSEPSKLYGRVVGTRHRIFFTAREPVFKLERKLNKQKLQAAHGSKANARYVVSVTEVPSVPTKCIKVDSPDHTFLAGRSYTVTHNCEESGNSVLLRDGTWRKIEDLADGNFHELLTWDLHQPALKPVTGRVTANGKRPVVRFHLANGHKIGVTQEHPLCAADDVQWRQAQNLKVGDRIVCLRHLELESTTPESDVPSEEAEILGYLLAGEVRGRRVFVRKLWKSEHWSSRRARMFKKAMWELVDHDRDWLEVVLSKSADSTDMHPYVFINQLATIQDKYPVDLSPEIWRLHKTGLQRLLTAFFVTAFCDPRRKIWTRGRTVGVSDKRYPKGFVHKCYETGDMIRRLALRLGVSIIVKQDYYFTKEWLISVPNPQVKIFYPSKVEYPDQIPLMEAVEIVKIEHAEAETWAVEILDSEHSYISGGVLSHNTTQMIGHVLWRLGKDPNISIGIFQNSKGSAINTLKTIKEYIEDSVELHDVFPNLVPGTTWSEHQITVPRSTFRRDPSVKAVSLGSKFMGDRFDGLILDDVDNPDTVLTEESRKKTEDWVRRSALSRLTEEAWAIAIGNIWHEGDLMHQLVKSGWNAVKHPVLRPDGTPLDPDRFTLERIYHIRDVDQKPIEFERLYMLKERRDGDQRFRMEWIANALKKGNQNILVKCEEHIPKIPSGCRAITGVDLGVKKKASSDPTVITTILEAPAGKDRYEYQILNIKKGRWDADEIMKNIAEQQRWFGSQVFVESNGCFVPGTRVLTPSGYVPIEKVEPGTLVWTHMGRWRKVINRYDGTARHVTPVKATGSLSVTCTPNHAFYVRQAGRTSGRGGGHHRPLDPKGWCSIGFPDVPLYLNLALPVWPAKSPELHLEQTKKLPARAIPVNEKLALVLGLFMAEGHTTTGQVFWTLNKNEGYLADLIDEVLSPLGFKSSRRIYNNTLRVVISQVQLAKTLKCGKGPNKCLPLDWMGWPLDLRIALVRGWLLGDGCAGKNGNRKKLPSISLSGVTISRDWALFVRSTLHQAGITVALRESARKQSVIEGRIVNRNPSFLLNLTQDGSEQLRKHMTHSVEAERWGAKWWDQSLPNARQHGCPTVIQADGVWARMKDHDLDPKKTYIPYENGPVHNLVVEEDESFTVEDFVVHNAQDFLVQLINLSGSNFRVTPFNTGRNKYDPMYGIESLAGEMAVGYSEGSENEFGLWYFPSIDGTLENADDEIQELVQEMLAYTPGDHTGDLLMSLWIAREGARNSRIQVKESKFQWGRLRLRH
jgi:intein/homing endonuclease